MHAVDMQNYIDFNKYILVVDTEVESTLLSIPHRFSMDDSGNTSGLKLLDLYNCSSLKIVNANC